MSRPTRPARAGAALVGLLLSAGVTVPLTAAPAVAVEPMRAHTSADCDSTDQLSDEGATTSSIHMPRDGQPIAAAADADAQTASVYGLADLRGSGDDGSESCRASASFENLLHVGAGTSGLDDGEEVTLVATVAFDPLLDEANDGDQEQITSWQVNGGYTVVDPDAPCIPDEESGDYCADPDPLARFVTFAQRTVFKELGSTANQYTDPDGHWDFVHDWDWSIASNTGQAAGDDGSVHEFLCHTFPCTGAPEEPSRLDPARLEPIGPHQLVFSTTVGATLEVGGAVSLLVQAYDGDVAAFVDATEGLSADIAPAAGFERLQLTLGGDAPPLDETAPVVTATPSSAPSAAGWHRDPVTVLLEATDAGGTGVESVTYALDGGAPTTVPGASLPVMVDEDGTTTVSFWATDAAGNSSDPQTLPVKLDGTAPALHLPSGVTVAATSAAGAVVEHAHSASDALSGATSSCTPATGSTFPVGTTTVSCTAVDGAGNTATGSFPVTVTAQPAPGGPTPAQRLDALQSSVAALSAPAAVKATLGAKLGQAEAFVAQGKRPQACRHLAQFADHVQKNTGRKGIPTADAARLTADAAAIRTSLGC